MSVRIFNHFKHFRCLPASFFVKNVIKRDLHNISVKLIHLNNNSCNNKQLIRKYAKKIEDEEEEEDYLNDGNNDIDKNRIIKIRVQSLRLDLLLKSALNIARNKIEGAFYENKIRLNGKKIAKKSVHVSYSFKFFHFH